MRERITESSFEAAMLPHLDAAYNLARWLTKNEQDAQDVVQEAYLRALRFFDGFRGGDARAWLLVIVRNTCYTWIQKHRARGATESFDEELHTESAHASAETELLQDVDRESLRKCIEELPEDYREVIVLRELEGMSYREIAEIANIPAGTVMSRIARARKRLESCVLSRAKGKLQ